MFRRAVKKRGENFSRKFCKNPLAFFCLWVIFLPVAGNEPSDDNRRPLFSVRSKAKTKNKKIRKKPLTKRKTAVRYTSRFDESGE